MKNTIKFLVLLIFLSAAVLAFNTRVSAQTKSEILIVADQRAQCSDLTLNKNCLQVKRITEQNFQTFSQEIENFRLIPGYFYVLEVQVRNAPNPPADASNVKYRLVKILARVKSENVSTPIPPRQSFSGTEWKLTRIESQAVENSKAFIKFDEENGRAGGNGGCNSFGGTLEANGNQIKISKIISTKMACVNQNTMQIESKFLNNLERITKYDIRSGKLYLSASDEIVLEFAPLK